MKRTHSMHTAIVILAILSLGVPSWVVAKTRSAGGDSSSISQKRTGWEVKLPMSVSTSWWSAAQKEIRRSEYRVTWQEKTRTADLGPAWQAPNRAHNLRTYFTAEGIRVIPRTESAPRWEWGVRLSGWGYEGELTSLPSVAPTVSGNRVEYRRGTIAEWYVNDERGLEQGFTIAAPPSTKTSPSNTTMALEMPLSGALKAHIESGNVFFTTQGDGVRVMDFGSLKARDASGRELPSRFALSGDRLAILVDVRDAAYPVTVDPLATSPSWTLVGDQTIEQFGWSVSSGDVNGDGYSDVIVGAVGYTSPEEAEGAVFVFYGSASGLGTTPVWRAESNLAAGGYQKSEFGYSVCTGDLNGDGYDDVIVGAPHYRSSELDLEEGGVFVYYGSSAGLGPNGTPGNAGWKGEGNQKFAEFGHSVSTADVNGDGYDDLIVGVANYSNGQSYEGRVCVFHGSATGPVPNGTPTNANWKAESDQASAYFGWSVSTAGDVNGDGFDDIIVGAPFFSNGQTSEGGVFVYYGSAAGLGPDGTPGNADWRAESDWENSNFGYSVSTAGDVNGDGYSDILVGASQYSGCAYAYYGSASGLSATPGWTKCPGGGFVSVSTAGDVDGDGFSDVILGAPYYTNGQYQEGAAFLYHGSAAGLSTTASWTGESDQEIGFFGNSVSTAGDVNGDGYSDVIVGAPGQSVIEYNHEGAAFVFLGSLDASKPPAVLAAAKRLLFPEDALPGQEDLAAFRYVRNLYEKDEVSGEVVPHFENMPDYYSSAEFARSNEAEEIILSGLAYSPDDQGLWGLLFDIYYHRTAAAQILAGDILKSLDEIRLGITGVVPSACSGLPLTPVIDREICVLEQAMEAHRYALQGGFDGATAAAGGGYFNLFHALPQAYEAFQTLMPGRDLNPPTYWDPVAHTYLPVGGSPDPLFEGYKDLVLLFGLLRDTGRVASRLAPLYAARGNKTEAEALINSTQSLLLAQGRILLEKFPGIEDTVNPTSGVEEAIKAIAACREALTELTTVAQLLRSGKNPLGFDEDFLIFMDKPGGSEFEGLFHSYDLYEEYLDPVTQPTKPLGVAIEYLQDAIDAYNNYQSTQTELSTQLGSLSTKYKDRLEQIVGYSPDETEYENAKANPMANTPWGELGQQLLSIEAASLGIDRNRQEMDNLQRKVQIEVERQGAVNEVYIDYGEIQASLTDEIGQLETAQAAANATSSAFHGLIAQPPFVGCFQAGLGMLNATVQVYTTAMKSRKEAEKERLAATEKADIEGINSAAQIKTWLLEMNVLAIDSQEAVLLMTQELARLKGLVNEVVRLETGLKEANSALSRRYFADPIHRMRAEGDVRRAIFSFENAQRWTFFMARALEYKWNVTFQKDLYERTWTVAEVTRLRNADELYDAYLAMDAFDSNFVYGGNSFDVLSLRRHVLGLLDGGQYEDPLNPGTLVDAVTAFRNFLKLVSEPDGNLHISFSTAREFPGTSLFLGPTFDDTGTLLTRGRYLDKISKLLVAVVGTGASSETQLTGYLTYGGTSYIRRQHVGDFDPASDRFQNELTTYSTRFWTEDVEAQRFVSEEAQTVSIDAQVNPISDLACFSPTVGEITALRERSVATSGWGLIVLNPQVGGVPVLDVDKVDDIEIHICHNWKDRLPPQ